MSQKSRLSRCRTICIRRARRCSRQCLTDCCLSHSPNNEPSRSGGLDAPKARQEEQGRQQHWEYRKRGWRPLLWLLQFLLQYQRHHCRHHCGHDAGMAGHRESPSASPADGTTTFTLAGSHAAWMGWLAGGNTGRQWVGQFRRHVLGLQGGEAGGSGPYWETGGHCRSGPVRQTHQPKAEEKESEHQLPPCSHSWGLSLGWKNRLPFPTSLQLPSPAVWNRGSKGRRCSLPAILSRDR